jgi:hypothetical protein
LVESESAPNFMPSPTAHSACSAAAASCFPRLEPSSSICTMGAGLPPPVHPTGFNSKQLGCLEFSKTCSALLTKA